MEVFDLMPCQACSATCSVALPAVTTRGNIVLVWSRRLSSAELTC